MNFRTSMALLAVVTALTVSACGSAQPAAPAQTPVAPIKSGAIAMRQELSNLKAAVEAGDAAKSQASASETDEAWEKFEDAVKDKDKTLYGNIEEPLHTIMAGVKVSPLDKKLLGEQIAKLDALLIPLTK